MSENISKLSESKPNELTYFKLLRFLLKEYISSDLLRILKHIHPKFMPKKPSITSSTFKLLSSKEFTPKNRFCESGTRITTLINKETNKPIDAYVARVETEDPLSERRCIMVKDDNGDTNIGNETFSVVGTTYFYIDKENKIITPKFEKIWIDNEFGEKELCEKVSSYMKSYMNDKYAGIGTRLHQIRIERMLMNQLGNVLIVADGNSFPFHYNLGFRLSSQSDYVDHKYLIPVLKNLCNLNKKSQQYNLRFISIEYQDGKRVINVTNSIEKCLCDYYKNGGTPLENFKPNMFLTQNSFEERGNLILTQPILLNMETENTHD